MVKPKSQTSGTAVTLEIDLPDKKYFTIGEVAELCELKSHVLRYWEQVFPQLEPNKRSGRRYYQRNDVELILEIKELLHNQGFTIPGAKARLDKKQVRIPSGDTLSEQRKEALEQLQTMKEELQTFRNYFNQRY